MAFRASNQHLADGYGEAKRVANQLKTYLQRRVAEMAAGPVDATVPMGVVAHLRAALDRFEAIKAIPGMSAYAKAQEDDALYDVAGEFAAMTDAIVNARDAIIAALPQDAGGWLLVESYAADGTIVPRTFTSVQTAGVRTALQAVVDAIA